MIVLPDTSRVWGIDISHWNQLTDLQTARNNGCHFTFIKACDGSVPTKWFPENKARAKAAGMPWGVYVWLYPGSKVPVGTQVNAWWNLVKNDYPPLGVVIDFEWTSYGGKPANPNTGDLISALDKWQAISGRKAMIYTAKGYTDQYAPDFTRWDEYGLWVAHYGVATPLLPKGATRWKFWQWTATMDGNLAPSENLGLDGDYYYGTAAQFAAEFGGVVTPPPGGAEVLYGQVNTGALNVRNGAGAGYTDIGDLLLNDLVTASETRLVRNAAGVDVAWWHLTDATRNGQPVTLADGITIKARAEGAGDVWASSGNGGYIMAVEPPPSGEPVLTHTIEVFSDGSLRIDGVPV